LQISKISFKFLFSFFTPTALFNFFNSFIFLNLKISIMKKMFVLALGATLFFGCNNEKATEATTTTETAPAAAAADVKAAPAEFADAKYGDMGRKALAALSAGDIDGWMANYADNAVYVWNNGDSLAGKTAIMDYWKKRRTEAIDSITFTNQIFLPIKVNQPQSVEQPGVWLLGWYMTSAKYKTGKRMTQWINTNMHFNDADKIDRVVQILDRVPINAAMTK
jgi:hypothetical protein